jgi:Putative MetA-pathway of phenol degradation
VKYIFPSFTRDADVGLGDISWRLRYAAIHEEGAIPEVTLNVNAKSDTGDFDRGLGTGDWNVGTGVSLVKTIDPVVLFGSLGYTWTLGTLELAAGDVDRGDQILYSLGMGFSLNDRVSFSMAMAGAAIRRTEVNGSEISGSGQDINSLQFTTTVQLAKRVYLEPFVGFGLTDEASDFLVGSMYRMGLRGGFPSRFSPTEQRSTIRANSQCSEHCLPRVASESPGFLSGLGKTNLNRSKLQEVKKTSEMCASGERA